MTLVFPVKDTILNMMPNRAMAKQLAIRDIPSLVYDAVNLVASKATTQSEFNLLENVFSELVNLDQDLCGVCNGDNF